VYTGYAGTEPENGQEHDHALVMSGAKTGALDRDPVLPKNAQTESKPIGSRPNQIQLQQNLNQVVTRKLGGYL
jgi:hypothetical protein